LNVTSPHEPPSGAADLPVPGGRIGPEPEDFVVDEVPAYEPSGAGDHVWVQIRKRGLTTADAIHMLARAAGVPERDVGSAGMKDKHAVTSQWLSLPASTDPSSWVLPEAVELLAHTRHTNKLRTGQQAGNRFRIRLVDVEPAALEAARAICQRLEREGLRNYFGGQRFGLGGENLSRALGWLSKGAPMLGRKARFYSKLYSSVVQSELFNRYLTARAELGLGRLLAGEVVRLDGSGSLFRVEDPEREAPRLAARDIHPTGPMIGPKSREPAGEPLELEQRIAAELGLDERMLAALFRHAPGARRDLVVFPGDLELAPLESNRLELAFFLPSGSYATELVRQLTGEPLLARRSAAAG
jgi:tRNA pseudouridine13 synthase